jgi:hypothetical protein
MLHEFGLTIQDKQAAVPYKAELVVGNTTNDFGGFGNQVYDSNTFGHGITSENDSIWLHELTGMIKPWNMTIGRQGLRLNKFLLQRPDTTSFYMQRRWDDHTFRFDGAKFGFGNKDAGTIFAGTVSNMENTDSLQLQPIQLRSLAVQRMMGANYDFRFSGDKGKISASYVDFDGSIGFTFAAQGGFGSQQQTGISRQGVYGVDLNYDLGGLQFELGGGKSTAYGIAAPITVSQQANSGSDSQNLDTVIASKNSRWDVALGSKSEDYGFRLAYRNVEANYIAPGDWGRVSVFRNLTDTKAYTASGSLMLMKKLGLHGWYEKGEAIQGAGNYSSWKAGVGTKLTAKWNADLTFEDTNFHSGFLGLPDGASSKFRTLKLGYDMDKMKSFNVFWQQSELDRIGLLRGGPSATGKGDFYGFQYSLKF